jgi:hypothetical protein
MFVEFDCGCIGILTKQKEDDEENAILIRECENQDLEFLFVDYRDKTYEPLENGRIARFMSDLNLLLSDGRDLRELKMLLKD